MTGEDMLFAVADTKCRGSAEDAARKIINDFRSGRMGPICLQVAPDTEQGQGTSSASTTTTTTVPHMQVMKAIMNGNNSDINQQKQQQHQQQIWELAKQMEQERARNAMATAKERGLELPPALFRNDDDNDTNPTVNTGEVGKGLFEGW